MKTSIALSITLIQVASLMVGCTLAVQQDYTRFFGKCGEETNTFDCLKRRALNILDSAIQDKTAYALNEYISVGKDPKFVEPNESRSLKKESLDQQLEEKFYDYISSRSLQLTIPGDVIEGRKKKDKSGGLMMMAGLGMAAMMAQLAMGKIAFLAGTALLTAKIALVLSAIIGLKKLASGGGGSHEVIYATASEHHGGGGGGGGSYGGGWQRSLGGSDAAGSSNVFPVYAGTNDAAQDLAYRGYKSQS